MATIGRQTSGVPWRTRGDRPNRAGRPRKSDVVEWAYFGEDVVIYQRSSKQYLVLTSAARLIWDLADGQRTLRELVQSVARDEPDMTSDDVESTYEGLRLFGIFDG